MSEIVSSNDSAIIVSPLRKPREFGNIQYKGKADPEQTFDFVFLKEED
jgi:hypothetical protein